MGARAQLVRHVAHLHRANAAAIFFAAKTQSTAKNAINTETLRKYLPEHSNGPSSNGIGQRLDRTCHRQRLLGCVVNLENNIKHEPRASSSKVRRNYHPYYPKQSCHCHRDTRHDFTHRSNSASCAGATWLEYVKSNLKLLSSTELPAWAADVPNTLETTNEALVITRDGHSSHDIRACTHMHDGAVQEVCGAVVRSSDAENEVSTRFENIHANHQ